MKQVIAESRFITVALAAAAGWAVFIGLYGGLPTLVGLWSLVPVLGLGSALTLKGDQLTARQTGLVIAAMFGIAVSVTLVG